MKDSDLKRFEFLYSSLTNENEFQGFDTFLSWYESKVKNNKFIVKEIPFNLLEKWNFELETKNLRHSTGKFFSIEGININTNFGFHSKWEQPIIIQPEIGILGIITKVFKGIRYFLMQAKMEPGNVNLIQISPTVQATRSNYTKVHNGKLPKYLEYFLDYSKSKVIIDQLQSEQGGRFLKKRNRNMVIEVSDDLPIEDDFIWLTLSQIKMALKMNNVVNMDSRSVLSTIPIINDNILYNFGKGNKYFSVYDLVGKSNTFGKQLFESAICLDKTYMTFDQVISWITQMKTKYELIVNRIPIRDVRGWNITDYSIEHESKSFFSIIAVDVQAGNREVIQWTQPLLKEKNLGLIGYIVKNINGVLHFLVQAKVEPGTVDAVDLAPTVSCSNYIYVIKSNRKPPFLELFNNPVPESILLSTIQSEEGGRFSHFQNRNMIIQVNQDELNEIPENYKWLTLSQLMNLIRFGYLNIESRSLISAISFI
jgi:oxidase EvaA